MHVLGLEFKCKQFRSQRAVWVVLGSCKADDKRHSKYSLDVRLEDSLFLLGETEFHSVNKHRKKRLFPEASTVFNTFTSVSKEGCLEHKWPVTSSKFTVLPRAASHISSVSKFSSFSHRWKDEYLILFSIPELSDRGLNFVSGSELDSFDQSRLQGDGKLIQRVQDARKGVDSSTIAEQSAILVHPRCQGQLCQEGEPVGEKPVPVENNGSIISNVPGSQPLHFLLISSLICEELMLHQAIT